VLARVGNGLTAANLQYRVLDADDLRQALIVACGLEQSGGAPIARPPAGPGQARERWSWWQAAGAVHVCFAVRGWPADPRSDLLAELAHVPAASAVSTAVVLRPVRDGHADAGGARVAVRTMLRVTAAPDRIGGCVRHLLAIARRRDVRLVRLNGEHAVGVYATAPTGAAVGVAPW
jgi:hypothetical protein